MINIHDAEEVYNQVSQQVEEKINIILERQNKKKV